MLLAVLLATVPLAAAAPPGTPPGLAMQEDGGGNASVTGAATASPPWEGDRPSTLRLVALTTLIVLSLVGATAFGYHRFLRGEPVQVRTDAEQVLALMGEIDGTATQPDIRGETGWSASKVSRVTDGLEEDGKLEKLRLGRENILRRT